MQVPYEFELAISFYPGSREKGMTNDQWIDSVVGRRTATVRSVSK